MKKLLSLVLALVMLMSVASIASAEEKEDMTLRIMLPDFYSQYDWMTLEDGNPILQAIYDATGVKMEIEWVADQAYGERVTTTLSGKDTMPEIMVMQGPRDSIMIDNARAGAFWDLTDLIPQYDNLAAGQESIYENISIDGRIYGLYRARDYARAGIYYRKDYAEKAGITAEPTNVEEFKALCFALAGLSEDTYCINMCKYVAGTIGITTVMFGAPYQYGIDENGKIYPAFEDAHFQEGLDFLRELYAAGGMDPDFATIESGSWNDAERSENPKALMRLDCLDNGYRYQTWLADNLGYDAENPVVALVTALPTSEGNIQIWPQNIGASGEVVVTKAVTEDKLPRVMEFLNWLNSAEGQTLINNGVEGVNYWMYNDVLNLYPEGEAENATKYTEYNNITLHSLNQLGMQVNGGLMPKPYYPILRQEYAQNLLDNAQYVIGNPCYTYDSETNTLMGATLNTDLEDAQVKYIANIISLEELQAEYQTWHDMGGDMILAEYQAIYDAE